MTTTATDGAGGHLLAIASGKGGVGKTVLAIGLAQALAREGQRVLLVDADLGLANVDVQLGLDPRHDVADVLAGRLSAAAAAMPHEAGLGILPGRSGSGALAALDGAAVGRLEAALRAATTEFDTVLLDLGAGLDAAVRRLAAAADLLLVVATEEPTSLTDAYAVVKLHRRDRPGAAARLVVNQAGDRTRGERTWRTLDQACSRFLGAGLPLAGIVARDARVADSIRHQAPLLTRHPGCPAARDIASLAKSLSR
ncbi:cobyrinic acid a,c-diamide synthase [Dankookia rubra]|uniref:Cobyrinic acid a,c-diamide synthase n=1 Tax=Dankookia rubra TaxID=1442381 RepID=A0A4R5Q7V3_9PROT|nr:cellulose synthase operon protein YhjQ/BcsQ [Dankookia rubra]TDH58528.1 cobyrinic acid a,c-diamide synthase [Dankookia rubra]